MKATLKMLLVCLLFLLLLIPLFMIKGVIQERERYRFKVINEISSTYGNEQIIVSPVIEVTYTEYTIIREISADNATIIKQVPVVKYLFIVPRKLEIDATAHVEKKNRRIYYSYVYNSIINMKGTFFIPEDTLLMGEAGNRIDVNKLNLHYFISDKKGLKSINKAVLDGEELTFKSVDRRSNSYYTTTLTSIEAPLSALKKGMIDFEIDFTLNGSNSLEFVPIGEDSTIKLATNWPHPSFHGALLPDTRTIDNNGFSAMWKSSWLSGQLYSAHMLYSDKQHTIDRDALADYRIATRYIDTIDIYSLADRSVKYGFLIIGLTFLIIFVLERLLKVRVHPVQYILTGGALGIFFLLLLSLAEHMPYAFAYTIGSVACISLITFYSYFFIKDKKATLMFGIFITLLYVTMYALLNISDYALLAGSGLIFVVLAAVMIATRNTNWYDSNENNDDTKNQGVQNLLKDLASGMIKKDKTEIGRDVQDTDDV